MPKHGRKRAFLQIPVSEAQHDAVRKIAAARRISIAEWVRRVVAEGLNKEDTYYYVLTKDGALWPDSADPGFEDEGVARLSAAKRGGTVVTRVWHG